MLLKSMKQAKVNFEILKYLITAFHSYHFTI
jgi:hypothetical protein